MAAKAARKGARPSRTQARAEALREAAAVQVPEACDVCVVGAGASGLACAIAAAEAGASVVALEAAPECGRTILATGNGRCNFANVSPDPRRYSDPAFVEAAFGETPLDEVLAFFRGCGMRWQLEGERLYPMSFQAASVRNVLLARARRAGVTLAAARPAERVEPDGGAWKAVWRLEREDGPSASHELRAKAVVLACGPEAPVVAQTAREEGLGLVATRPVLCPVACERSPLSELDGRRVHGALSLVRDGFPIWRERGEVMLRSYGLSGIVTFDLSRRVKPGDVVLLDLAPDLSKGELQGICDPFASGQIADGALDGVLDPQIAAAIIRLARTRWEPEGIDPGLWGAKEDDADSARAIALAKALPFRAAGVRGERAQVTAGGLALDGFDPATLEARGHAGLLACGEALDIDADCGGYNLMWAWKSGMAAGASAARIAHKA